MGQKPSKGIFWNKKAVKQLQDLYNFIAEDSYQNAVKVRNAIADMTVKASLHPESFPPDKFKRHNKGNYRYLIKYRYRVSYRIDNKAIRIIRIRHTKMKPLKY